MDGFGSPFLSSLARGDTHPSEIIHQFRYAVRNLDMETADGLLADSSAGLEMLNRFHREVAVETRKIEMRARTNNRIESVQEMQTKIALEKLRDMIDLAQSRLCQPSFFESRLPPMPAADKTFLMLKDAINNARLFDTTRVVKFLLQTDDIPEHRFGELLKWAGLQARLAVADGCTRDYVFLTKDRRTLERLGLYPKPIGPAKIPRKGEWQSIDDDGHTQIKVFSAGLDSSGAVRLGIHGPQILNEIVFLLEDAQRAASTQPTREKHASNRTNQQLMLAAE